MADIARGAKPWNEVVNRVEDFADVVVQGTTDKFAKKISKGKFKDSLAFDIACIGLIEGGTLAAPTILPAPSATGEKVYKAGAGYFSYSGSIFEAPVGKDWYLLDNGSSWSLKDMGALPDNSAKIEEYVPSAYTKGTIKIVDDVYLRAVRNTNEVAAIVANDWEIFTPSSEIGANIYTQKGFVEKGNGSLVPDGELISTIFLKILSHQDIVVTGYSGRDDAAALGAFYDEDRNFISSVNAPTQGWVGKHVISSSSIPTNAVWFKSTKHINQNPFLSGVDLLIRPNINQEFIDVPLKKLAFKTNELSTRNKASFFDIQGFIEKGNGTVVPDGDLRCSIFLKLDFTRDILVNGYSGLNDAAGLCVFFDKNLNFISSINAPTHGIVNNFSILKYDYPTNAVYARFTRHKTQVSKVEGVFDYMSDYVIQDFVSNKVGSLNYVDSDLGYFNVSGYINKVSGELIDQDDFVTTRFLRIDKNKDLLISGYSGRDDAAALCSFYDKKFRHIKSINAPTQGIVLDYLVNKNLFPAKAEFIRATSTANHTIRKVSNADVSLTANDTLIFTETVKNDLSNRLDTISLPYGDTVRIRNYKGNYQNVHPKVLYFPNGLWGYKYWMGYTPFPWAWDQDENPSIAVSNDGIEWTVPTGLENPLAYAPANGYNSDTHLVWREDTQTLELWYRPFHSPTNSAKLVRRTTLDGVIWTPEETIQGIDGVLSPSIIFENGKYKVWFPASTKTIYYTESSGSSPVGWSIPTGRELDIYAWHMDVIRTDIGLEYLIQGWEEGGGDNLHSSMFYMKEIDGVLTPASKILSLENLPGNPNQYNGLYRGSILKINRHYKVFYSYIKDDGYQGMMLAEGSDIYRLLPFNREVSRESEVVFLDEDQIINELYVHSAKYIHVKDCDVIINAFTGLMPNAVVEIIVTGSGSCQLVSGSRIDKSVTITSGKMSVLSTDSRNVVVI